jgi:hypothetical protein
VKYEIGAAPLMTQVKQLEDSGTAVPFPVNVGFVAATIRIWQNKAGRLRADSQASSGVDCPEKQSNGLKPSTQTATEQIENKRILDELNVTRAAARWVSARSDAAEQDEKIRPSVQFTLNPIVRSALQAAQPM